MIYYENRYLYVKYKYEYTRFSNYSINRVIGFRERSVLISQSSALVSLHWRLKNPLYCNLNLFLK